MTAEPQNQDEKALLAGLARPAQRALVAAGIRNLEQLATFSEAEIGQLHGIGPNAIAQLRRSLRARGLSFA